MKYFLKEPTVFPRIDSFFNSFSSRFLINNSFYEALLSLFMLFTIFGRFKKTVFSSSKTVLTKCDSSCCNELWFRWSIQPLRKLDSPSWAIDLWMAKNGKTWIALNLLSTLAQTFRVRSFKSWWNEIGKLFIFNNHV